METLGELIAAQDSWRKYCAKVGRDDAETQGFAPMEFGGRNGSHHGATASKLAERGLTETRKRGYDWGEAPKGFRGSKVYRPTQAGRDAFEAWWQAKRDGGDAIEIMGKLP